MPNRYRDISARPKNRALTERRLIDAVGAVIRTKGYKNLGVNAVAKEADVNKKLIYRYFGTFDKLIEAYILENDYWMNLSRKMENVIQCKSDPRDMKEVIVSLLEGQFTYFLEHPAMQDIILWEITEHADLLNSISNVREIIGHVIFEKMDTVFKDTGINLRAISAILVSGIYYMILHAKKNESTICEINVSSVAGQQGILKAVRQIINWAFEHTATERNED